MTDDAKVILDFWFDVDLDDPQAVAARNGVWFMADPDFDRTVSTRFSSLLEAAGDGALSGWEDLPRSSLALVLLLDQMPRNIHRGTAAAFACDSRALAVCEAGIARGRDQVLHPIERLFYYMPMQHAEDLSVQERSVATFDALAASAPPALREALDNCAAHAREHRDIVAQFGRFPHRNPLLGRAHTPAEQAWLEAGGRSFGQGSGAHAR